MSSNMLGIEKALERAGGSFINKYRLMRDRLLNVEMNIGRPVSGWEQPWPGTHPASARKPE